MRADDSRRPSLLVRVAVYVTIAIVIFALRGGGGSISSFVSLLSPDPDGPLTLSGADLAPGLLPRLIETYDDDYEHAETRILGGGTNLALEDLLLDRAAVAFLWRPPDAREQALFVSVHGDSALAFPVALGAIVVLRASRASRPAIFTDDLALIARGIAVHDVARLYVADPNTGLWDALAATLDIDPSAPIGGVVFLEDDAAVVAATVADTNAVGLVSDLAMPDPAGAGLDIVPVGRDEDDDPSRPTFDAVATGTYPLTHYLYVCCRANAPGAASKFVTHVTGRRGQRQVERAGYLPARHVARPVVLSREPLSSWIH